MDSVVPANCFGLECLPREVSPELFVCSRCLDRCFLHRHLADLQLLRPSFGNLFPVEELEVAPPVAKFYEVTRLTLLFAGPATALQLLFCVLAPKQFATTTFDNVHLFLLFLITSQSIDTACYQQSPLSTLSPTLQLSLSPALQLLLLLLTVENIETL